MTADPRRVARFHSWTKWVWVACMPPTVVLYFTMSTSKFTALFVLVTAQLGQAATEQAAESRFPEEEEEEDGA
jgi:hypothetical protein